MIKKTLVVLLIILNTITIHTFADTDKISSLTDEKISEIQIEGFDIVEFKNEIISEGKLPRADSLFKTILIAISDEAYKSFLSLVSLIIPIMLYGVLTALSLDNSGEGVMNVARISCYVIISTTVISVFTGITKLAYETILNIDVITKCMIPVLYTLMLTTGKVTSAVTMHPTVIFISQIMLVIINKYLLPLIMLSFSLAVTDNITGRSGLKNFSELINKFVRWTLVFILSIFTAILSAQNILGYSFDKVALKGTKFAVTNFIPIVGGALAEGVETIGASLILIKNATGIAGIVAVLVAVLVPIIKIYSVSIMFHILSAVSQPVCGEKLSMVLKSTGTVTGTVGVLVICMSFVFIIFTAMIIGGIT